MITSAELAQAMLVRLHRELGYAPQVEQVDFVACESGDCTMAYCYSADADCLPVLLPVTEFNEREVAGMVCRGQVSVRAH